jgi:hypothetical protein
MNPKILLGGVALIVAFALMMAISYDPNEQKDLEHVTCTSFCSISTNSSVRTVDHGVCVCSAGNRKD